MNGVSVCLDEIALEGLDGITLSALWIRLKNANPPLESTLDNSYKEFLWRTVLTHDVETFLLEEPRKKLEIFADDEEVYPFNAIGGQENGGIRGSCSTFHSRKPVNVSKDSLDAVEHRYGERLVLVASQAMREAILFPSEIDVCAEITDMCYYFLEWVARARELGRMQSSSPTFFSTASKSAFHYFKVLHQRQLVTKQAVSFGKSSTCIVRHVKFNVEQVSDNLAVKISDFMEKKPGKSTTVEELCSLLLVSEQSILQSLSLLLNLGHIKSQSEEIPSVSHYFSNGVALIKPFPNQPSAEAIVEEDSDDDDEGVYSTSGEFPMKITAELPINYQIYQLIVSRGVTGISFAECNEFLGLPWYDVRLVLRQLEQSQKITVVFQSKGKQRIGRYIASYIFKQNLESAEKMIPSPQDTQPASPEECQNEDICGNQGVNNSTPASPLNIMEMTKQEHKKSLGFTERFQKRRKWVTDYLAEHKVCVGEYMVRKFVLEREAESGIVEKMDKKTFFRFLKKLKEFGTIQFFHVDVDLDGVKETWNLVCDINMKEDSPEVLHQISVHKDKTLASMRVKRALNDPTVDKAAPINSAKLGYLPKMPRAEMLHIFLYIVIYELAKPHVNIVELQKRLVWTEHLTPFYFLSEGYFTAASVLLHLPLSLFVKLIGLSYQVPQLEEYLSNPATRHMLIKDLPKSLSCHLTNDRYILPRFLDTFGLLASMNLIIPTSRFEPPSTTWFDNFKDVVCRLTKKASLLDTSTSLPGYREVAHPAGKTFPETVHNFSSLTDVTNYWYSLRDICLSTLLGVKTESTSKSKGERYPKPSLKNFIREVEDDRGDKPFGDGKGAAGLDSTTFAHLKRQWIWTDNLDKKKTSATRVKPKEDEDWQESFSMTTVPAKAVSRHTGGRGTKRKATKPAKSETAKKKIQLPPNDDQQQNKVPQQKLPVSDTPSASTVRKRQESIRKEKVKEIKRRAKVAVKRAHWSKVSHDQRDLEALKRNVRQRITFTPQEEKLLFLCTLALRILGKKSADTGYKDWIRIRDMFYNSDFETTTAKTALSISRKHRTIMKNRQTQVNLNICTFECKQEKEFQRFCNLGKSCDDATFVELVELLKKKYSMESMKTTPLHVPHNLKSFQRKNVSQANLQPRKSAKTDEDITSLKPPVASVADIRQGVLRDSIFSTLLLNDEKYNASTAYMFLDQFAEEELSLAISTLKKNRMVVKALLRYGQGRKLALNTFSQTLSTNAQRILDGDLASSVIQEAISFYHELKGSGVRSPSLIPVEEVENTGEPASCTLSSGLHGGIVAAVLTLLSAGRLCVEMQFPVDVLGVHEREKTVEDTRAPTATSIQPTSEATATSIDVPETEAAAQIVRGEVSSTAKERQPTVDKSSTLPGPKLPNISTNANSTRESICSTTAHASKSLPSGQTKPSNTQNEKDQLPPRKLQVPKIVPIKSNVPKNHHIVQNTFADALCGIEDHLFGNCGQALDKPNYKVELRSKSSFSCSLITTDPDVVAKAGSNGLEAKACVEIVANTACKNYSEKVLPIRMAGTFIRPLIVTNPCIVKVWLSPSVEEGPSATNPADAMELVDEYFKANADVLPENLEECLRVCSKEFYFADKDCQALATVYKCIESGEEIGVSKSELEKRINDSGDLSNFSLNGLIRVLQSFSLVHEVGFVESRFVTHLNRKHWALTVPYVPQSSTASGESTTNVSHGTQATGADLTNDSPCGDKSQTESVIQPGTKEKYTFTGTPTQHSTPITRPWFTLDGHVNKSAYNIFHESVLRYIMRYPGADKFTISKHFVNMLFPFTLDCVLKTLEDNHCISKTVSQNKPRRTLFAKTNIAAQVGTVTYFLPTMDAIVKLADNVLL